MRVIKAPLIEFKCFSCGALCAGEEHEFTPRNTMPPTFYAQCAFCDSIQTVSPTALVVKRAVADANAIFGPFFPRK